MDYYITLARVMNLPTNPFIYILHTFIPLDGIYSYNIYIFTGSTIATATLTLAFPSTSTAAYTATFTLTPTAITQA